MRVGRQFIGAVELPWTEGVHGGPSNVDRDRLGASATWTLSGMAPTHVFFNHVVLRAAGPAALDPVMTYWAETGLSRKDAPYIVDVGTKLLDGPAPPDNHIVYACPTELAGGLLTFLDRYAGRRGDEVWDSVRQDMPVRDQRLISSLTLLPPRPPCVTLTLYGFAGPRGAYYWLPPKDVWKDNPRLVYREGRLKPMPHKYRLSTRARPSTT